MYAFPEFRRMVITRLKQAAAEIGVTRRLPLATEHRLAARAREVLDMAPGRDQAHLAHRLLGIIEPRSRGTRVRETRG